MRWNDEAGWMAIPDALDTDEIARLTGDIEALRLLPPDERHPRDKPAAGTRHVAGLQDRVDGLAVLLGRLQPVVGALFGRPVPPADIEFRSPQPGFGAQKLHADDMAKLDDGPPHGATSIVALCDFDETNGSTRVVPGSHRRPDLQRCSGRLESHPDEIRLTGPAGTAFVFSAHLLHSGTRNNSDAERPALQICWRL